MESNYIKILCDTSFLDNYKYISKEQYIKFIQIHIDELLSKFNIQKLKIIENNSLDEIETEIFKILNFSSNLYYNILNNVIDDNDLENIIYELVKQKIVKEAIDNIILLEEIDYIEVENKKDKLKLSYYYMLEIGIYNYFNVDKVNWKDEKQKKYVMNKVMYSSLKQKEIKEILIQGIERSKNDKYRYNKKIGILSIYPIREIKDEYDKDIMLEIYKIKYILTLDSKLQKCSDNKLLKENNDIMLGKHKNFFKEMLKKYKKLLEGKDSHINSLQKEKDILEKSNKIKDNTIINYANCINEYNNMPFWKKLKRVFKKEEIKLLN